MAAGVGSYQLAGQSGSSASGRRPHVAVASESTQSSGTAVGGDPATIAANLDDSIVNINTTLSSGGQAAGTGIIISSSGLVLTNNHVIADSTSLQVENSADGSVHSAKVLGYDVTDDVALVQIEGVSDLTPAPLGSSSSVSEGDSIVALGNAGGKGGAPSVVSGTVVALDQQITASNEDGSNSETLADLIEVDAAIEPGDSGGPLANTDGEVVGMNAAAEVGNGRLGGDATNEAYAIPIENAIAIAEKIKSGDASTTVHIGDSRAMLGVAIQSSSSRGGDPRGNGGDGGDGSTDAGVAVHSVDPGSAADDAGIVAGDVITAIGGTHVGAPSELTNVMSRYAPKDTVEVAWTDASGASHHASVVLGSGPPA